MTNLRPCVYNDHHFAIVFTSLSSSSKMSQNDHASVQHRISFDREASSPAAVTEGPQNGYFNDQLTRDLLGLEKEEVLLNSGTYGAKEPGHHPVEFALLRQGDFEK
jgi:hypothetical protein